MRSLLRRRNGRVYDKLRSPYGSKRSNPSFKAYRVAWVRSDQRMGYGWFARISQETGEIDPHGHVYAGKHRDCRAWKDLERWLTKVELPYHSPVSFDMAMQCMD